MKVRISSLKQGKNRVELRVHPDFPSYYVSENGFVYSMKTGPAKGHYLYKVASFIKNSGYVDYPLTDKNGRRRHKTAHRLVAECYIDNPDNLPEVNHKDLNKLNCHKDNLEWTTHRDNQIHAAKGDAWKRIKDYDVETIRQRYLKGEKQADIAKDYGVHQTLISAVIRERGKSLSKRKKLSDEQVAELRDRSLSGSSTSDLAREYGIPFQSAYALVRNKRRYCAKYGLRLLP